MDLTQPAKTEPPHAPACCKCGGQMELGFLPAGADKPVGYDVGIWVAGTVERGLFGSVKVNNPHRVYTFACLDCGYLESYIYRPKPV